MPSCWYVSYNNERKFNSSRECKIYIWAIHTNVPCLCWVQVVRGLFIVIEDVVSVFYRGIWTRMWDTTTPLCNFHLTKTAHAHPVACSVPPQLVTHQITVHGLVIAPRRIIVSWWNMGQVQMLWHSWILTRSLNNSLQFHYHWTSSLISHLRQHLNFQRSGSKHISKPI